MDVVMQTAKMALSRSFLVLQIALLIGSVDLFSEEMDFCNMFYQEDFDCTCVLDEVDCNFERVPDGGWENFTTKNDILEIRLSFDFSMEPDEHSKSTFPYPIFVNHKNMKKITVQNGYEPVLKTDIIYSHSPDVVYINLEQNDIQRLETGFKNLKKLGQLFLNKNKLKRLDKGSFKGLTFLLDLDLENNEIEIIEAGTFDDLTSLEHLYLQSNKLKTWPEKLFSYLTELIELKMDENEIMTLKSNSFSGMDKLKTLTLNKNKISKITSGAFKGLKELTYLELDSNNIMTLSSSSFKGLPAIATIKFSNNKFLTMKKSWFIGVDFNSSYYSFDFSDNPYICNCEMEWLLNIQDNHMMENNINGLECTVSSQFPYPGKEVGLLYKLKDFKENQLCKIPSADVKPLDPSTSSPNSEIFVNDKDKGNNEPEGENTDEKDPKKESKPIKADPGGSSSLPLFKALDISFIILGALIATRFAFN